METIQTITEIAFRQLNPNPQMKVPGDWIAATKTIYAARMWYMSKEERASEGQYIIPSQLLVPGIIKIEDNMADISGLKAMKSIPGDMWIQELGDGTCEYVRMNLNDSKKISEESFENAKPYIPIGTKIMFPFGIHGTTKELPIIYVSDGTDIKSGVEVDRVVADFVIQELIKRYGNKQQEDKTVNNNANN